MKIVRKIRVYPTLNQSEIIDGWLDKCRFLYNSALQHRIWSYEAGLSVNVYDQKKELPLLKQVDPTWKEIPNKILTDTLFRLEKAFKSFFNGGGFPKYKAKHQFNSIVFVKTDVKVGTKLLFPKGLELCYKEECPDNYSSVSLTRNNGRYYVCFVCDIIGVPLIPTTHYTAIDLGLKELYVTDNGFKQQRFSLKLYKNYQKRIKYTQQSLAKKIKDSSSYLKTKKHLAKAHERLANSRKDYLQKASTRLIKKVNGLIVGDIEVQSIVGSERTKSGVKKSFYNVALSSFKTMLLYKGLKFGKAVHFVPENYTSKTCSVCSHVQHDLKLSDRIFKCSNCKTIIDRDQNGAINIKKVWFGQFKPNGIKLACFNQSK